MTPRVAPKRVGAIIAGSVAGMGAGGLDKPAFSMCGAMMTCVIATATCVVDLDALSDVVLHEIATEYALSDGARDHIIGQLRDKMLASTSSTYAELAKIFHTLRLVAEKHGQAGVVNDGR